MAEYLHYDRDRTSYTISETEMDSIINGTNSYSKDVCLACLFFGLPTIINAIGESRSTETLIFSWSLLLNFIFGINGIILSIVFGIVWHKSSLKNREIIKKIKNKPRIELNANVFNVGALEESVNGAEDEVTVALPS